MSIKDFYNLTVSIERLKHAADAYGGDSSEYESHIASYACRIYQPKGEMEILDIGKFIGTVHKAMGADADIKEGDKLINGSDQYIVKKAYKVYAKSTIHHLELLLDKII